MPKEVFLKAYKSKQNWDGLVNQWKKKQDEGDKKCKEEWKQNLPKGLSAQEMKSREEWYDFREESRRKQYPRW